MISILSICDTVNRLDSWRFRNDLGSNQSLPPHPRYIIRTVFRFAEVVSRMCCIALCAHIFGFVVAIVILGVEVLFYLFMYWDKLLGDSILDFIQILMLHPNLSLKVNPKTHVCE